MLSIPLKKLFNLQEIVLFSQFHCLVPLVQQYTAIYGFFYITKFYVSLNSLLTKTN